MNTYSHRTIEGTVRELVKVAFVHERQDPTELMEQIQPYRDADYIVSMELSELSTQLRGNLWLQ